MARIANADEAESTKEELANALVGSKVLYGGRANPVEVTNRRVVYTEDGVKDVRLTIETNRGATRRLEVDKKGRKAYADRALVELEYRDGGVLDDGEWQTREYHGLDEFDIVEESEGRDRTDEEEELLGYEPGDEISVEHEEIEVEGTIETIEVENNEVNVKFQPEDADRYEDLRYSITAFGTSTYEREYNDRATRLTKFGAGLEGDLERFDDVLIVSADEELVADGGRDDEDVVAVNDILRSEIMSLDIVRSVSSSNNRRGAANVTISGRLDDVPSHIYRIANRYDLNVVHRETGRYGRGVETRLELATDDRLEAILEFVDEGEAELIADGGYVTERDLRTRFDGTNLTGPAIHEPEETDAALAEGDRIEHPYGDTFEVYEAHAYEHSPDRFEVAEVGGSRELSWREHHVENVLAAGASIERGAGTGDRLAILEEDA